MAITPASKSLVFSANADISAQTARLAAMVTTDSVKIQGDLGKLQTTYATMSQNATQLKTRGNQLLGTAPHTTASEVVSWLDDVISWLKDWVSWAQGADWWGWLNWFINDLNSVIADLQNLVNWVNANKNAINEFGTIVSDAETIIGWIVDIMELV